MPQFAELVHKLQGLSALERYLQEKMGLERVYIVPGDSDKDKLILSELGKLTGRFISNTVKSGWVVSVTGGTTMAEVSRQMPLSNEKSDILVVPARGGLGESVEIQANTIAAKNRRKAGGSYRLLYVPDDVSERILEDLLKDHKIQETIALSKKLISLSMGLEYQRSWQRVGSLIGILY